MTTELAGPLEVRSTDELAATAGAPAAPGMRRSVAEVAGMLWLHEKGMSYRQVGALHGISPARVPQILERTAREFERVTRPLLKAPLALELLCSVAANVGAKRRDAAGGTSA